jgi:hypothetical protein
VSLKICQWPGYDVRRLEVLFGLTREIWFPEMFGPLVYSFIPRLCVILYKHPSTGRDCGVLHIGSDYITLAVKTTRIGTNTN